MARTTFLNTADDMKWLRDVHLPRLSKKFKSAVIHGNEDYPEMIEVYERRDPVVTDRKDVFQPDENGVYRHVSGTLQNPTPPPELDMASNLFGKLKSAERSRLMAVIEDPNQETWSDAHGIILDRGSWMTLWQAIIAVDPTFPKRGAATDRRGRVVEPWPRIPSRDLILKAIRYATH